MRYANAIRAIVKDDENTILRLADHAPYVHLHPDYSAFDDWLKSPAALIQMRDGDIRGLLVALCDPPPIAWLRVIIIDQHEPAYPLRKLIDAADEHLHTTDASHLACLSSSRWLDEELPKLDFVIGQEIVGMEWEPTLLGTLPMRATPPSMQIRKVQATDFGRLVAVEHAAFDDPLWWSSQTQMERAAQGAVNFDVVEVDGEIVGFTFGAWTGRREAHIVRIAVLPAVRGQGVGAALLRHALQGYAAENFQHVTLNTQRDNAAAHHLYTKFGFKMTGDRFGIWVRPIDQK